MAGGFFKESLVQVNSLSKIKAAESRLRGKYELGVSVWERILFLISALDQSC